MKVSLLISFYILTQLNSIIWQLAEIFTKSILAFHRAIKQKICYVKGVWMTHVDYSLAQ